MGRKPLFPEKLTISFPIGTLDQINSLSAPGEEKQNLVRDAVRFWLKLNTSAGHDDLKAYILSSETVDDFCLNAIAEAVETRKLAVKKK